MTEDHSPLAELSRMAQESAESYLAGDLDTYATVLRHADDFTLMPPFGGPTRNGRGLVGDLAEQDWSLRVTLVFRRDDGQWRLVHRHADALVHPIGWNALSQLARGDLAD